MDWNAAVVLGTYLTFFALVWVTVWWILEEQDFEESSPVRRLLGGARTLLAPWPLLWLLAYGALLLRAWHAAGEWPRLDSFSFSEGWTANVRASMFPLHVLSLAVLDLCALAALFMFVPLHATLQVRTLRSSALLVFFAGSCAAYLWVVCTEGPANAVNWLAYTS